MRKEEIFNIFEKYVLNKATDAEIKYLSNWIRNNPELSEWFENKISYTSDEISREVQFRMFNSIKLQLTEEKVSDLSSKTVRLKFNKWLRAAAILLLPLITALGVYIYMSKSYALQNTFTVAVERGQKANVTLPDGSKVWLNSLSELQYTASYNMKSRALRLNGEAYFEVAHNPQKPFIVTCNDIQVEALGTAFGVKAYNEDELINTILMRGKVKVNTPDGSTVLLPNDRVLYNRNTKKTEYAKVTNATDFTGWIHNELRFENETLFEIAKNIQRIYNVQITFSTESLKNLRYTGTVNNNSLENVLNIITLTSPVSFHIDNQKVILSENEQLLRHYN